jgi:hypothetical protein
LRPQLLLGDEADGFHFSFGNRGEPCFDDVDAEFVQPLGYSEFVFRYKGYSRRLFTVS